MNTIRKRWSFLTIFAALMISLFLPFELTMATSRHLIITDTKGGQIPCVLVRQIWHQYSLDVRGEEDLVLLLDNTASLPNRKINTTVFSIVAGAIKQFRELGIHASYFSDEMVGIFAKGYEDKWLHGGANPEKRQIVLSTGATPRIKMKLDKYKIQNCMDLRPGIKVNSLTEMFWLPDIESKEGDTVWLSFELENAETKPILARVRLKDGAVLELRCPGQPNSQWILDSN